MGAAQAQGKGGKVSKREGLSNKPKNARPIRPQVLSAWWYENRKSIDVFIEIQLEGDGGQVIGAARIYWRDLLPALERARAAR